MVGEIRQAYLYTRISTLQQATGFGIERQINTVTDFLTYACIDERLGYCLSPDNYTLLESDIGKSAYHGRNWKESSALGQFYLSVMNGTISDAVLVCENVDRLVRMSQYKASSKLVDLITHGIDIVEVESGMVYSEKIPETKMILDMSITRAHMESKRKSSMSKKSWDNRIDKQLKEGKPSSKVIPRWLSIKGNGYVVDKDFSINSNYIFNAYVNGFGVSALVDEMNTTNRLDMGVRWTKVSLHRLLKDKRIIGYMRDYPDVYPCVISKELFNTVQSMIGSKSIAVAQRTTKYMRNLFSGITRCAFCGEGMVGDMNGHKKLFLTCIGRRHKKGCEAGSFPSTKFESGVLNILHSVDWAAVYSSVDVTELNSLRSELAVISKEIEEYETELVDADEQMVLALVRVLKKKRLIRDELISKVNKMNVTNVDVTFDIESVLDQGNVDLRRETNLMLRRVIKSIRVGREGSVVMGSVQYYSDYYVHYFCLSVDGSVLATCSVSRDWKVTSNFMDVDLKTGETSYKDSDGLNGEYYFMVMDMVKNTLFKEVE